MDEQLDLAQERLGTVEGRLDGVAGRLGRIEDELLVLNGIALRLEGLEIETTRPKRYERWLGELGRRVTELEDEPRR